MCLTYRLVRALSTACILPPDNISFGAVLCMNARTTAQPRVASTIPVRRDASATHSVVERQHPACMRGQVVQVGCGVWP